MGLDKEVMKLAMTGKIKEQIYGIFGPDDADACIAKCHSIIELAETLKIKEMKITVTLSDLIKAKKEYNKTLEINDD